MEVKSVGKSVRMSQPQFGNASTEAVQKSLVLLKLNLTDSFEKAVETVTKKVSLEHTLLNGIKALKIKGPNYEKAITYDEKELQKSSITSNLLLFANKVSAAMFKAEESSSKGILA